MTEPELHQVLQRLLAQWESECVEFKAASNDYDTSDIGKYFSALSNEANLRGLTAAWLVFGVDNKKRQIISTDYRLERERLHGLKHQIAQGTDPSTSFREIHELHTPSGRVVLFEIPAAPRGLPIAWQTHFYARDHPTLTGLSIAKQDEIRAQGLADDWSAIVVKEASIADVDSNALAKARAIFTGKYSDRIPEATIRSWDDAAFLEHAKLTHRGGITRACLLLLGREQATTLLNPYVAELSWKLEGPERGYEHFHPPFLLNTSRLFQRIRPLRLSFLPPGQLIPVDVPKYDERITLEALHNCIAHQDYTRCERILVIERLGELEFQNAGQFFDGTPDGYISGNRSPRRYRNRCLAEAMVTLRMIDTMGFGIRDVMWKGQARRYLPLPDYDLSDPGHVKLRLQGRFLDENYSRALLSQTELHWSDVLALDQVQKGILPALETIRSLRRRKLIEGRKPNLHVSAAIAAVTGQKAGYIRTRRQDDAHFRKLILDCLQQWKQATTAELRDLLRDKLPEVLTPAQQEHKVHNLLTALRQNGQIVNRGSRRYPQWVVPNS